MNLPPGVQKLNSMEEKLDGILLNQKILITAIEALAIGLYQKKNITDRTETAVHKAFELVTKNVDKLIHGET